MIMKKIFILILMLLMIFMLSSIAMGGTIGVNVDPGVSVGVSKGDLSQTEMSVYGSIGINDKLWISPGYNIDAKTFTIGVRYEILENMAAEFDYSTDSTYVAYFRMKQDLNEKLGIIEELSYDSIDLGLKGQAEYLLNDYFCGNVGINYVNSVTSIILGGEFYIKNLTLGFDYTADTSSVGNGAVAVYAEYKL
jgi:hypothetical protein